MSEYQYYGWQAIDRPLDERELEEVSRLSGHMDEVTSMQAPPSKTASAAQGSYNQNRPAPIVTVCFFLRGGGIDTESSCGIL